MRDPKRIDDFCERLAQVWHMVPDWRFGQFISNVFGEYSVENRRNIFFVEDKEMIEYFEKYFDSFKESQL